MRIAREFEKRNCKQCGKEFFKKYANRKGDFCSQQCYREYRKINNREEVKCLNCGKEFSREKSTYKKYCSDKCRREFAKKGIYVERECLVCGQKFTVRRCQDKKLCSIKCRGEYRKRKQKVICEICGKEIILPQSIAKNRRFCSNKCMFVWRSSILSGENHPNYKDGKGISSHGTVGEDFKKLQLWRREILKRSAECEICGATKQLEPHHIKPWALYPESRYELSNGKVLCKICHKKEDDRYWVDTPEDEIVSRLKDWKRRNPNTKKLINRYYKYFEIIRFELEELYKEHGLLEPRFLNKIRPALYRAFGLYHGGTKEVYKNLGFKFLYISR